MANMPPIAPDGQGQSTRPYLIRALHEWCTDNGFTPYIAVHVDGSVQVPVEYVKNNEIVLNVGFEATSGLKLGNQFIEFKARFGGSARDIHVPVDHVVAIYARENGQGMAFPMPPVGAATKAPAAVVTATDSAEKAPSPKLTAIISHEEGADTANLEEPVPPAPPSGGGGKKPSLKRVK